MSNDWQNNTGQQGFDQQSYNQPNYGQPQRGWFGRNWWWFIPAIILVPILGCGGCCIGVMGFGFSVIKSSDPYQMALAKVQQDPQVQQALGTPINDATWFPTGEFNDRMDQGDASLIFQVEGPKGRANVSLSARKVGGHWALNELTVTVTGTGERIVIDTAGPAGEGEAGGAAPAWNPNAAEEPQAEPEPESDPAGAEAEAESST